MIQSQSSTARRDDGPKPTAVGSSQTTRAYGIAPVSEAETVTTRFARPEDFEDALKKYALDTNAAAHVVRCRYTDKSGWVILRSPTLQLTADAFAPLLASRTTCDWWPKHDRAIGLAQLPATATAQVTGVGTGAQSIEPLPGLLNSTDIGLGISRLVESRFSDAVASAQHEWFEDGVESRFSRALDLLIHTYRDTAVSTVESFLSSPTVNAEVAVEAVQSLGEIDHPSTHRYRRSLLEKVLLTSSSTRLRHGAASGLAAMNDPSSLDAVREATRREGNSRLRRYLELVVDQLERARACPSS